MSVSGGGFVGNAPRLTRWRDEPELFLPFDAQPARKQVQERVKVLLRDFDASQVDNLVGNNDPACLWN